MRKLIIPPDNSAYTATDGESVVRTALDGGAGRYRRDKIGAPSEVEATWIVEKTGFIYLRAFFRGATVSGALPFEIDLILDDCDVATHTAYFKPGTFKLTSQVGLSYTCSATLEVKPNPFSISDMQAIVDVYNEFGGDWAADEDEFNRLINVEIPNDNL